VIVTLQSFFQQVLTMLLIALCMYYTWVSNEIVPVQLARSYIVGHGYNCRKRNFWTF